MHFFDRFVLKACLISVGLVASRFLPVFALVGVHAHMPFGVADAPGGRCVAGLPGLRGEIFPRGGGGASPAERCACPRCACGSCFSCQREESFDVRGTEGLRD